MWLTSSGLQVQDQHIPSPKLGAGNLKTPCMNFQSALTSTRQDLCTALPACLFVSDFSQWLPSCLAPAGLPVASISRDHFTTAMISFQPSVGNFLLFTKACNGDSEGAIGSSQAWKA